MVQLQNCAPGIWTASVSDFINMHINDEFANCENDIRLDKKVAIVTGATSGIGLEVAKNLAKRGAKVIIASRNPAKLSDAKNAIIHSSGNENVIAKTMDFESLKSIRNFANDINRFEPRLDILINNIATIGVEDRLTADNLHTLMQVNYFGAFLLTFLLFPLMKASAPSRIINTSSLGVLLGQIDIDHMNDVGRYSNFELYCNSKLATVLFTVEMDKRIKNSGVSVYSIDPGLSKTEFLRHYNNTALVNILSSALLLFGRPLHRVATMPVFVAVDPRVEKCSGKHFRDCAEFYSTWFANDTVLTKKLWEKSKMLVGITAEEDWETLCV